MEKNSLESLKKNLEIPIGKEFILQSREKIGYGSYGDVYRGRIRSNDQPIAIKLERINEEPTIFKESKFLKHLKEIERIPKLIWVGKQGKYNILIMNLLGSSLKNLMELCQGKFTLATTLKISIQILEILRKIHDKGVILRYLKPGNMVIGTGDNKNFVYLIDFGICKYYLYKGTDGLHIPYNSNKKYIIGNRNFISININNYIEGSRRDDIESLGYNLIYFMKGTLPWSKDGNKKKILNKKINTSLDELCEELPNEFKEFISYARKLEFTERPNYDYLKELLIRAAKNNGIDLDKVEYDWITLENKEIQDNKIKNEINVKQNENKESNNDFKEKEINKEAKEEEKLDDNKNENKVDTKDEDKDENKKIYKEVNEEENMGENKEVNKEETKDENKNEEVNENKKLNKEETKDKNKKEDIDENKELNKEESKDENKNEDINENKDLNKEEWKEENQDQIDEKQKYEKENNLEKNKKRIQDNENEKEEK